VVGVDVGGRVVVVPRSVPPLKREVVAGKVDGGWLDFLVDFVAARCRRGTDVVVVGLTAGAVVVVEVGGVVVLVVVVGALTASVGLPALWSLTEFLGSGTRYTKAAKKSPDSRTIAPICIATLLNGYVTRGDLLSQR
ncbi:MAG TPA: hypothetical protein VHD39_01860, partial [Acidimicrobiales bacterium]|nr:hypothetical protein [Acidimicrobiales bacterium]